jgi:hypothetical protein
MALPVIAPALAGAAGTMSGATAAGSAGFEAGAAGAGAGMGAAGSAGALGDAAFAGGGEVGSGYAASAPLTESSLGAFGDYAGYAGDGTFADSGAASNGFDLGGGLSVDEFGNVAGGLFEGGGSGGGGVFDPYDPSLAGGGEVGSGYPSSAPGSSGGFSFGDLVKYGKKAYDMLPSGTLEKLLRGIPGLVGTAGAVQQRNEMADLAARYLEFGAPSRSRFESSFAPGFTMANDPGYTDALNQTAKATLHGLSVTGNPADSPNAWMQTLSDVNARFAYPALQEYRRMNAGAGALANLSAAAPPMDLGAVRAGRDIYDAAGATAADIFTPRRSLSDLLRDMKVTY